MLKAFIGSIVLIVVASTSVLAKNTLVEVGIDNGEIVYLDTESIKEGAFKLYQRQDSNMLETTFRFSCGDSSLAITKDALYASNGMLLQANRYGSEKARLVDLTQPSPGLTVMSKICHSRGARGW